MTESLEDGEVVDILEAEEQAERDVIQEREQALAEALRAQQHKKGKLVDPLQFEYSIQAEDLINYEPRFAWEMGPATEKQLAALEKFGISANTVENAGKASLLMDHLIKRRKSGLSTPKQIRFLEDRGFQHVGTWPFEEANKMIGRISMNGWRIPYDIDPCTYVPKEAYGY